MLFYLNTKSLNKIISPSKRFGIRLWQDLEEAFDVFDQCHFLSRGVESGRGQWKQMRKMLISTRFTHMSVQNRYNAALGKKVHGLL